MPSFGETAYGKGAMGTNKVPFVANLEGDGTLTVDPTAIFSANVSLSADGSLTVIPTQHRLVGASLSGNGTITVRPTRDAFASANLSGSGNLTIEGKIQFRGPLQSGTPIEYIEESSFTEAEADPNMQWIGLITDYDSTITTNSEEFQVDTDFDKVSSGRKNTKDNEDIEISLSYKPQDLDFMKYFLGSSTEVSDVPTPIQIGEITTLGYRRLFGAVGSSFTLDISEDSVADVGASLVASDREDWSEDDYIGSGSHASDPGTTPLKYGDISNVQIDGTPFQQFLSGISINIDNDVDVFKTEDSSTSTEALVMRIKSKDITLGLTFKPFNHDITSTVTDYDNMEITMDIGDDSFAFSNVKFPDDTHSASPGEGREYTITSEPIEDVTII